MSGHFFYAPNEKRVGDQPISYEQLMRMNPHKAWATHAYNEIVLRHISAESKDAREIALAEQEIHIARRKQVWWEMHPDFHPALADAELREKYGVDRHGRKAA